MVMCSTGQEYRHGVPRRGYVLSTVVEEIARSGRDAVNTIAKAFAEQPAMINRALPALSGRENERAAWFTFSIWLVAFAGSRINATERLSHSEAWFLGRHLTPEEQKFWRSLDRALDQTLETVSRCAGIRELLPYILESHGPGSRLSVRRDPTTQNARAKKKSEGVFYTPVDVANFMAVSALASLSDKVNPKVLDPAVGTGVFLRAVLAEQKKIAPKCDAFKLVSETLFGFDIDPIALDGAASVLLLDSLENAEAAMPSPLAAWAKIRRNLRECDALTIDKEIELGRRTGRTLLRDIFPTAEHGFDLVIGNPPYAGIGARVDWAELACRFRSIAAKPTQTADLYPVFVEQMIRLCAPEGVGAMVVPLSLACNSGAQFAACRSVIQEQRGTWRFSFYDRQPHALFGEDVKTRNTILLWQNRRHISEIFSGPLRKWRGADRQRMLQNICYTPVHRDIRAGIPKIHGRVQANLHEQISQEPVRLGHLVAKWGRATLDEVPTASLNDIFVAPTAYNFMGIGRRCELKTKEGEVLSTNPLMRLSCNSSRDADATFAILSGNFAYWWWQVCGDGFHVNRATLIELPVGRLAMSESQIDELAGLGQEIWGLVARKPVRSLNRGRVSYAFSAAAALELRRSVDNIVLASLGQPSSVANELEQFTDTVTSAGLFLPSKEIQKGKLRNDQADRARDKRKEQAYERGVA